MTRFLFVRHATTVGIEHHLLQGVTDSPLSQRGKLEAHTTAQVLKDCSIENCFTSPLGRAVETAQILCTPLGLKPEILDSLREFNFGWLEGRQYFYPPGDNSPIIEKLKFFSKFILAGISGESLSKLRIRAREVWENLTTGEHSGSVLVITHGFFLNFLLREIFSDNQNITKKSMDINACSITEILFENHKPHLLRLNDTSHLKGLQLS